MKETHFNVTTEEIILLYYMKIHTKPKAFIINIKYNFMCNNKYKEA